MTHTPTATTARLPDACGPITEQVLACLDGATAGPWSPPQVSDPLRDRDLQLGLWMLYELHYRGFPGVDPRCEWDPRVLGLRAALEEQVEPAVRALAHRTPSGDVAADLVELTAPDGPSTLARFLARDATREEFVDYLGQRAIYHLRESDPQTFVLPRIDGPAKVALAELQYDEYGGGRASRLHSTLYARALAEVGLSTEVTAYLPDVEASMLATVNVMSLFALHRRLRGAALGHLAAFEATSSLPCRLVAIGAQRLELAPEVAEYYEEHVEADAVHEQVAVHDICAALAAAEPELADDMVLGAEVCLAVDEITAQDLLRRWRSEESTEPAEAAG